MGSPLETGLVPHSAAGRHAGTAHSAVMAVTVRIARGWFYRTRRVLATLCLALLAVFLGYKVVFGANGMKVWQGKRAQIESLQRDIDRRKAEHEQLQHRVDGLQRGEPSMIEKEAREQLGLVKPGEVVLFEQRVRPEIKASTPILNNTGK